MKKLFFSFFLLISTLFGQGLEDSLTNYIKYNPDGPNRVGHLKIGDHESQIGQGTWVYIKNGLDYYKKNKPIFIILELNTPGGQVFAAQKISDALKEMDIQHEVPIVCFINNWAISAGAMLAYSCRYISIVKDASMGAAQPLMQTGGKTEIASEKVNSAIRADFANRASFYERNPLIAEAMVDPDFVLVVRDEKIIELQTNEEIKSTDRIITKKGKLLTLNAKEMMELGVADIFLKPEKLSSITAMEKMEGKWPAFKELLFEYPFFTHIPHAEIDAYQPDWKTKFFSLIATPVVSSVLFLVLMISFYMELNTPGFGVPGVIGLMALFCILLGSFAIEAASWLELILLLAGIGLILLEVFVIPGFGITGILGIILSVTALSLILLPGLKGISFDFDTQTFNAAGSYFFERLVWLAGTLVIGVIILAILARFLVPKIRVLSPIIHRGEQETEKGFVAGRRKEELPEIGTIGIVVSPLRPAGKVEIEGDFYDAISSGRFIEKGEKVTIVGIEGSKMIVQDIDS
ncbi:MAG: ATP-dependent Clp protease proteolytic subunit [Chlamydiia bacterium]|nr:ATP-dependent Clp protease proteolytic subunit [Chlamydiia bacterium]